MKLLIITDIHANFEAFQSVLDDAGKWDKVLFLGDVANFGPNPKECVDLLRSLDPICIMGNHDYLISGAWGKRNFFDEWSRNQLNTHQLEWMKTFSDWNIFDDTGIAIHGAYNASYDILPGIPKDKLQEAFKNIINEKKDVTSLLFGHYHYQIDMEVQGINYHCIRPVGHHRDGDVRASYSIMENGVLTHYRVFYDLEKVIHDTEKIACLTEPFKSQWIELLQNAHSAVLLKKDIDAMNSYVKR